MDHEWNDNQPIYRQLRDRVVAMILEGVLKEGDPLPSVRNVAAEFRVNPLTVLKGYQQLVDEGVLQKLPYQEHPPRFDYRLTEKGRDLWHVLTAMRQWGDKWAAPEGPPLEIVHTACGQPTKVVPTCSSCGAHLAARDVRAVAGPGAHHPHAPPAVAVLP